MHSLVLITAMAATTGLFGGKHCGKSHHGRKAVVAHASASPCGGMTAHPTPMSAMAQGYPSSQAIPAAPPSPSSIIPAAPAAPPIPAASIDGTTGVAPVAASEDPR